MKKNTKGRGGGLPGDEWPCRSTRGSRWGGRSPPPGEQSRSSGEGGRGGGWRGPPCSPHGSRPTPWPARRELCGLSAPSPSSSCCCTRHLSPSSSFSYSSSSSLFHQWWWWVNGLKYISPPLRSSIFPSLGFTASWKRFSGIINSVRRTMAEAQSRQLGE